MTTRRTFLKGLGAALIVCEKNLLFDSYSLRDLVKYVITLKPLLCQRSNIFVLIAR